MVVINVSKIGREKSTIGKFCIILHFPYSKCIFKGALHHCRYIYIYIYVCNTVSDWQCNNDMHLLDIVLTTLQWVKQSRPTTGEAITHVLRTMFHHLLKKSGVVTSQTGFSAQFGTVTKSDPDNKQTDFSLFSFHCFLC